MQIIAAQKSCCSHLHDSGTPGKARTFLTWCYISSMVRESLYCEAQVKQESGKQKAVNYDLFTVGAAVRQKLS